MNFADDFNTFAEDYYKQRDEQQRKAQQREAQQREAQQRKAQQRKEKLASNIMGFANELSRVNPINALIQDIPEMPTSKEEFLNSDTQAAKRLRGFTEAFVTRPVNFLNGVANRLDPLRARSEARQDSKLTPQEEFLSNLSHSLEAKYNEDVQKAITDPQRQKEVALLADDLDKSDGVLQTAKAGGKYLWDIVSHPDEITAQGVTRNLGPENIGGFGAGALIRNVAKPLLRGVLGAGVGAAENATFGSVYESNVAYGSGATKEQADKIAKQGVILDTLGGAPLGFAGSMLTKPSQRHLTQLAQQKNSPNLEKTNEAVAVEAELRGDQNDKAIKNAQSPQEIERLKNQVTPEDVHLGRVYNDGKEVHPQVAGRKIIKKLENSLENNMNIEEVGHKLRDTYGLQGEYLDTALEAYAKGDTNILAKWMDEKHAKTDDGFEALDKVISEENKALDELRIKEGEVANDNAIKDFDEQLQGYHGKDAINALLINKKGHVKEAFFRDDIGAITLPYGKEGTKKSDGWGLSKIAKYHPEVLDKLDDIIENLPIIKETEGRYKLGNDKYFASIRKEYDGVRENWVLTAFEKRDDTATSRTDLDSTSAKASNQTTLESELGAGSPYPTHQSGNLPPDHGDGANARSLTNDSIISDSNKKIKNLNGNFDKKAKKQTIKTFTTQNDNPKIVHRTGENYNIHGYNFVLVDLGQKANPRYKFYEPTTGMGVQAGKTKQEAIKALQNLMGGIKKQGQSFQKIGIDKGLEDISDMINSLNDRHAKLSSHPKYAQFLEDRQNVDAGDTKYSKKQVSKGGLGRVGETEEVHVKPVYEDNHLADFELSKQDVRDLRKGNISEKLLDKLENDLGRLDNDPRYRDQEELEFQRYNEDNEAVYKDADGQEVDKNGHIMFVRGADNILAGALAGFEEDENGNIVFNPYKALLAVGGLQVAKRALKSPHIKAEAKNLLGKAVAKVEREAENGNPYAQAFLGRSYITSTPQKYLDKSGRVIEDELMKNAQVLPKPIKDFKTWKSQFSVDKEGKTYIQTPINKMYLDISKSFKHLTDNTHSKDRRGISGAFVEVFKDPLLIVRQDYPSRPPLRKNGGLPSQSKKHQKGSAGSQDNSIISNSIVFYKPFKSNDGNLHIAGFALDKNGKLLNTTFYAYDHLGKVAKLVKANKADILYDKLAHSTQKSKPQIEKHLEKTVDEAKVDSPQSAAKTIENVEKSVKLYGGIPAPAFQAVLRPIQKMQKKLIDGIDSFGKVKSHKENVRVEKITDDEFLKSTGINPKTIYEDGIFDGSRFKSDVRNVDIESLEGKSNLEISYDKYEIAFKNGRREFFKLGQRDVYDNTSILSGVKTQIFDQLSDDVVKHIHLNNAYSQNSMKRLAGYEKELSKLKPEDSKTLVHALDGDLDPNLIKNEKLRKAYTQLRDLIDRRAELLSELNMLDKEDIKKDYIKRLYTEYVQEVGFFEALKDKLHGKDSGGGHSGLARNYKRKDMSLEERVKKGQIFHANVVVTATLQAQENQIIKGMFFKKIAENFASVEEIPGYVKVPNDKAFGLLAGKYLPYQVHYSIVKAPIYSSAIDKAYQKAFSHWKVNKTVKNPGTQVYNFASNAEMMVQSHTSPLAAILGDWKKYIEVGEKYGLIDDTNLAHNLGEIVKKTPQMKDEKNQVLAFIETIAKEAYLAEGTKLGTGARWAYNWGDKLFKVTAMADNLHKMKLKKYEKIHGELSVEESFRKFKEIEEMKLSADEEYLAFKEANELFIDYQRPLPPAIDKLNRYMVPFTNFGWKSTPVKLKEMIKHPLTAMSINLAGGGIVGRMALASATYGGYKGMAEWLKGFIDTGDEEDAYYGWMKPEVLGTRLPYENMAFIPAWRKIRDNDESVYYWNQGRLIQGMRADFVDSFFSGGMPGQLAGYGIGVDSKTGRELYRDTDSSKRKVLKTIEKMAKDFLPSHFTNIPQKFYDAYMYGENFYGEELNGWDVPLHLIGVRRVNKAKAEAKKQEELQTQIRQVTNVKGRLASVKGQMKRYKKNAGSVGYSKRRALDKVEQIQRQYEDRFPDLEELINKSNQVEKWSKDYKSLKSRHHSKSQAQRGKALIDNFKKKLENGGLIDLDNTYKRYKPIGKLIDL